MAYMPINPIPPAGGWYSFDEGNSAAQQASQDLQQISQFFSGSNWQEHWPQIVRDLNDLRQNCYPKLGSYAQQAVRVVMNMFPSKLSLEDPPLFKPSQIATLLLDISGALGRLHS